MNCIDLSDNRGVNKTLDFFSDFETEEQTSEERGSEQTIQTKTGYAVIANILVCRPSRHIWLSIGPTINRHTFGRPQVYGIPRT